VCFVSECDIAVIGASTGGIEAVRDLLSALPESFGAAVLVVIHIADVPSSLPETLGRSSELTVRFARDGELLEKGVVLVAPPNQHLLLDSPKRVRLAQSARENGFRPAVDPLFRTAARIAGARVMGIVLSGALDDGAAGMREIVRHGGTAIVQDFHEAAFVSMPLAAARKAGTAHVLPVSEIAILMSRLAEGKETLSRQAKATEQKTREPHPVRQEREPTDLSCPQCGGVLRASPLAEPTYTCQVGHTYAPEALAADQSEVVDRALWAAVRVLHESAALRRAMAERARTFGLDALCDAYERQALEAEEKAQAIQRVCEASLATLPDVR
jgi:two-component system chemotaxis response regulator CheB